MLKLKPLVFLLTLVLLLGATMQAALAQDSQTSRSTVVILVDSEALAQSESNMDIAKSVVGLVSTLRDRDDIILATVNNPKQALGPVAAGSAEFETLQEQFFASMSQPESNRVSNFASAFAETYNILDENNSPNGSTIYLVSGSQSQTALSSVADTLSPTLSLYKQNDWSIISLVLPGASPESSQFLSRVSRESGANSIELTVPSGFKRLSDSILQNKARASLSEVVTTQLTANDVFTSDISVVPGTSDAAFVFFKTDTQGSISVKNPSGVEATVGQRTSSSLIQTPHVVIWKLVNPEAGNWRVDVSGVNGSISAWNSQSNKFSVVLESFGAVPINEPATIGASVTDGTRNVTLDGVKIMANITNPNGGTFVHELNDRGVQGDAIAGDGFFAATLPPLSVGGAYNVILELSWPQYDHKITSRSTFTAQPFPTIDITPIDVGEIQPGRRVKIAELFVNIQGEPYAVSSDQLIGDIAFAGELDVSKVLEINPVQTLDQGRAWEYNVFITPDQDGFHTTTFRLSLEYAGKLRNFSANPIIISSRSPAPPPQPVVPVAPPEVQTPPPPAPQPAPFPWGLMAIPAVAAVALLALLINWVIRTRPYGYLYNDQNELVVDFSRVTRNPFKAFVFRNLVGGKELSVQGFEDVSFEFKNEDVNLRSNQLSPTVRVNNQPLIERMSLRERAWIGTHGRLYSFLRSPLRLDSEPGLADD